MKRRWFAVFGAGFLLAMASFLAAFGFELPADPVFAFRLVCWFLAGLLFVVAGLAPSVGGVEWYRFVGVADVLLGLAMFAPLPAALSGGSDAEPLVYVLPLAVGGLVIAFIGFDWFRGGRNFDLSRIEDGAILGS